VSRVVILRAFRGSAPAWPDLLRIEAFLISAAVVALGEIGDKTQLLALLLAARFKKPVAIIAGILVATLVNHALAGSIGAWIASQLAPQVLRWIVGLSFIAIALWALVPDKLDEDPKPRGHAGVFLVTVTTFFLAEMGDKTQLATVALAARYPDLVAVVAGTTLGMLIADVPAVFVADRFAARMPLRWVRIAAAAVFAALGVATLIGLTI